jgi:AcrR family transcriptional regulator
VTVVGDAVRRRRPGRDHDQLLRAAAEVVAERGFEGTRFADVAARSGASISTLQYLFGTREQLVVAALRQATATLLAGMDDVPDSPDPVESLRRTVCDMLGAHDDDVGRADAGARDAWLVWLEYTRAGARDDELRTESIATFEAWRSLLREAVLRCVDAGVVPPPPDLELVVRGIGAMIDGFGVQTVLRHPSASRDAARATVLGSLEVALGAPGLFGAPSAASTLRR